MIAVHAAIGACAIDRRGLRPKRITAVESWETGGWRVYWLPRQQRTRVLFRLTTFALRATAVKSRKLRGSCALRGAETSGASTRQLPAVLAQKLGQFRVTTKGRESGVELLNRSRGDIPVRHDADVIPADPVAGELTGDRGGGRG